MEHSLFLAETRISDSARSLLSTEKRLHLVYESAPYNYALERSVTALSERAAGARRDFSACGALERPRAARSTRTLGGTESSMPTVIPLRRRPDVCPFFAECFEVEWPDWYGPGRKADAKSDLLELANSAGALPVGVVALDDDASPVGIAALKAISIDSYTHVGPWATAGYVIPSRRRERIGSLLLAGLLAEAHRLGFSEVYCATASADSLLEREGWTKIDAVSHDGGTQFIFRTVVPSAA